MYAPQKSPRIWVSKLRMGGIAQGSKRALAVVLNTAERALSTHNPWSPSPLLCSTGVQLSSAPPLQLDGAVFEQLPGELLQPAPGAMHKPLLLPAADRSVADGALLGALPLQPSWSPHSSKGWWTSCSGRAPRESSTTASSAGGSWWVAASAQRGDLPPCAAID